MRRGICKLCLKDKNLQVSHLLPRALYQMTRGAAGAANPDPIMITRANALRTSKQAKQYLLCHDCEGLFNRNGEDWILRQVDNGREFPLLNRLNVAMPLEKERDIEKFSGSDVGIETDKLAYFALSVVWRASVVAWFVMGEEISIALGEFEESFRQYLIGEASFPENVVVVATVSTDYLSRDGFLAPARVPDGPHISFAMLTRGIWFRVVMDKILPAHVKRACCVHSARKVIFTENTGKQCLHGFHSLMETAKVAGNLQ